MWIQYRVQYKSLYTGHILYDYVTTVYWTDKRHIYWYKSTPEQVLQMWNTNQAPNTDSLRDTYRWVYTLLAKITPQLPIRKHNERTHTTQDILAARIGTIPAETGCGCRER
jgi:hypothetical protein